ncbi:MAG: PilT/PilU family type 4a pilus ATPase [Solirubrobacteraceae bacterium]|nr:PilT/PilU family type 4a pilus ATPase [Solirubrobacteraceae bacterium]
MTEHVNRMQTDGAEHTLHSAQNDAGGSLLTSAPVPALLDACLTALWDHGGTDLIITAGAPPLLRIDGEIHPMEGRQTLTSAVTSSVIRELLGPELTAVFERNKQADFAFSWRDQARLRGNAFMQKGTAALALRMLTLQIPTMDQLNLPATVQGWTDLPRGLVLVTGPTGSGKSTTLASMLDHINTHQARHIVTIEDPIEYFHFHKRGAVNQREVGPDTNSFADGLRAVLREDPDVLLIGEMRDPESIQAALTIAETGHLVFATLHTNDTAQTFDRIVDVFPAERQPQIRLQLAHTLAGVLHQLLIPRVDGGRVAAFDVLNATQAVRNLVREGKTRQIRNIVATGQREGMQTLEMSLSELVVVGVIGYGEALEHSLYPDEVVAPAAAEPALDGGAAAAPPARG